MPSRRYDIARRHLLPTLTLLDIAERSRAAGLAFINHAARWEKTDLAGWLVGPYQASTGGPSARRRESLVMERADGVETRTLVSVLTDARVRVLAVLESAVLSRDAIAFARRVAERGLLADVVDCDGRAGWIPLNAPHVRLTDRVLTLFATDALCRPADYEQMLAVCHLCEGVRIAPHARETPCDCERRGPRPCPVPR
jgi:hypothetical protein